MVHGPGLCLMWGQGLSLSGARGGKTGSASGGPFLSPISSRPQRNGASGGITVSYSRGIVGKGLDAAGRICYLLDRAQTSFPLTVHRYRRPGTSSGFFFYPRGGGSGIVGKGLAFFPSVCYLSEQSPNFVPSNGRDWPQTWNKFWVLFFSAAAEEAGSSEKGLPFSPAYAIFLNRARLGSPDRRRAP